MKLVLAGTRHGMSSHAHKSQSSGATLLTAWICSPHVSDKHLQTWHQYTSHFDVLIMLLYCNCMFQNYWSHLLLLVEVLQACDYPWFQSWQCGYWGTPQANIAPILNSVITYRSENHVRMKAGFTFIFMCGWAPTSKFIRFRARPVTAPHVWHHWCVTCWWPAVVTFCWCWTLPGVAGVSHKCLSVGFYIHYIVHFLGIISPSRTYFMMICSKIFEKYSFIRLWNIE